jgi:hypothetical protein
MRRMRDNRNWRWYVAGLLDAIQSFICQDSLNWRNCRTAFIPKTTLFLIHLHTFAARWVYPSL